MKTLPLVVALVSLVLASCHLTHEGGADATPEPPYADAALPDAFAVDSDGVVGRVVDVGGDPVAGGAIYFVPAADVAALPPLTLGVGSTDDEPLEDLIAINGPSYPRAPVGLDGTYALDALPDGEWFVTFVPALADEDHLPGGSACRIATAATALRGTQLDVTVSSTPPAGATYVGTAFCVPCHAEIAASTRSTMHRLGIWSPYQSGALQLPDPRRAELWAALDAKFEPATTIYYYDYDGTRKMDKYKTSETSTGTVSFAVTLFVEGGAYKMRLVNVKNPADPERVYTVDAIYGGGVLKQRYLAEVAGAQGKFYANLPVQYQHEGREESLYGRTSKTWRDYNGGNWYDETTLLFKDPTPSKSFEKNCISCHATGVRISGSDATNWTAELTPGRLERAFDYDGDGLADHTVVAIADGDFDWDGNGTPDELNIGCETCHGPGSAHVDASGACQLCHGSDLSGLGPIPNGKRIVSPELLTPEREAIICGQCHSRPKGAFGTDSPVDDSGWMMPAGTSRDEFLSRYATTQLDGEPADFYADPGAHSKSHHQQYTDFIRGAHYRNDRRLMTCSDCHDAHGAANPRQLLADPDDNVASCGDASCHIPSATVAAHDAADTPCPETDTASCRLCHMPKTAKTGAGRPGIVVDTTQYWQSDISSHVFDVPDKSVSKKVLPEGTPGLDMPTGYTDACAGGCHVAGP